MRHQEKPVQAPEAEVTEEDCSCACVQLAFLHSPGSSVMSPTSTISQDNLFTDMTTCQTDQGNSSTEIPSSQVTLG